MLRNWLSRVNLQARSIGPGAPGTADRRKTIQGAVAILCVLIAAICMWSNAQTPISVTDGDHVLVADADEHVFPPPPDADREVSAPRQVRLLPPAETRVTLDQLVIHVDKHGNIDVAGELINTDVFRNLLHSVKEDSTGDVSVLIHANEKCEVSTLQKVVDVCEECLTQYRLRIEDNRSQSKPTKPALTTRA